MVLILFNIFIWLLYKLFIIIILCFNFNSFIMVCDLMYFILFDINIFIIIFGLNEFVCLLNNFILIYLYLFSNILYF